LDADLGPDGFVRLRQFWDPARCGAAARAVLAAREVWTPDFDGEQFCLGRAWYAHLETDRTGAYFAGADEANARVEATVPGLHAALQDAARTLSGRLAAQRPGWCGAGVHIFPAGGLCARTGGERHFDEEGLTRAQLRARVPAWSLVLYLQTPASGGGLRLWEAHYEGRDVPTDAQLAAPSVVLLPEPGDLVVFDSYRLHQIQPFGGDEPRISATLHAARTATGWETWF
jgi:hypothetical protein